MVFGLRCISVSEQFCFDRKRVRSNSKLTEYSKFHYLLIKKKKKAIPNNNSIRGMDVVNNIKTAMEKIVVPGQSHVLIFLILQLK